MRACLVALSLLVARVALADEPTEPPKTDPKTWAKQGWQALKWGMGPGDVLSALGASEFSEVRDLPISHRGEGQRAVLPLKETLFGQPLTAIVAFSDGRLRMIILEPRALTTPLECSVWAMSVRDGLRTKYGEPAVCLGDICTWRHEQHTMVQFNHEPPCDSSIRYVDLAWTKAEGEAADQAFRAESEKL